MLVERGAVVTAYDPLARDTARLALAGLPVSFSESLEAALKGVDAVVLCTRWDEFERVPALLAADERAPLLVDGRRMLEPGSYHRYAGIGRRDSTGGFGLIPRGAAAGAEGQAADDLDSIPDSPVEGREASRP